MEMPFMAELPKREKKALGKLWDRYEEFKRVSADCGGIIPAAFAAEILNVSRQRVFQLIESGKLERVPLDGFETAFVSSRSVEQWARAEHKNGRPCKVKVPGIGSAIGSALEAFGGGLK